MKENENQPTLARIVEEEVEKLKEHPAMKFAGSAIIAQAVRTGTGGYTGKEKLDDFLKSSLTRIAEETVRAVGIETESPDGKDRTYNPYVLKRAQAFLGKEIN